MTRIYILSALKHAEVLLTVSFQVECGTHQADEHDHEDHKHHCWVVFLDDEHGFTSLVV